MSTLRDKQKSLRASYESDPKKAFYTYHVRTADSCLDDPLRVEAESVGHAGSTYSVSVNERVGGDGIEQTPGDLLLASLAACKALSIKMVASGMRIQLTRLQVDAWGDVDHRGVMMVPGASRIGFTSVRTKVSLDVAEGTPAEKTKMLLQVSEMVCAATDAIKNKTPIESTCEVNGIVVQ